MLLTFAKEGLPLIVGIIYAFTAIAYLVDKQVGYGMMWAAYGVAQVGIILSTKGI